MEVYSICFLAFNLVLDSKYEFVKLYCLRFILVFQVFFFIVV